MSKILSSLLCGMAVVGLTACSSGPAPITKAASKTPPRLIMEKGKKSDADIHPMNYAWDKIDSFGAVPASLQKEGDKDCVAANFRKAVGYHPAALGVDGAPIKRWCFFVW